MDTERSERPDEDPAFEDLARESHFPVGDVLELYKKEMRKLSIGAHIKGFLSIFALRNARKILLNRSVTKEVPLKLSDLTETGHPALPTDRLLPFAQPLPIELSPARGHEKIARG